MTRAIKREKLLLSGNEALALGAYESGVSVASAYPGTPSTEILENLRTYEGVYTEWAPNEKVAVEVALGASFAGVRALATMKHVGLNVAADPLFTASYTGVRGGFVIICADDPEMHSSQNEQDNRNYAFAAKVPMLEPSDPSEAKEFLKLAYEISEEFDTPVIVRTTTRVAHVKGICEKGDRFVSRAEKGIVKDPRKLVMLPAHARMRRRAVEERMNRLREFAGEFAENRIEWGDKKRGFITSSVSYLYVKEAFPGASVLKLGLVWPMPEQMIQDFASKVDEVIVVEELDPFIELHVKAMGVQCKGKELIPAIGELNTHIVKKSIAGESAGGQVFEPVEVPMRPPNMCPGCPHRGVFHVLSKLKVFVSGDIGCYTLGALPPLKAMDSCVCMGASIGNAFGMEKALGDEALGKVVAVIGDSTFVHSGITGLIDIVYNKGFSTVVILDNRTTAMTGHQANPAAGISITGEPAPMLDLEALCKAVGVKHVRVVNPHNLMETREAMQEELKRPEPSVIITKAPCVLLPEHRAKRRDKYEVTVSACTGCRACVGLGCPAIEWVPVTPEQAKELGFKEKQKGHSRINPVLCDGCGQCYQLCKFGALNPVGKK